MKFVVYRTTNKITGRYYVGVKKTSNNLSLRRDGEEYYGSGPYIQRAVNCYGEENFKRDIIAVYEGDELGKQFAYSLEALIVNKSTIYPRNPMSYNLKEGGIAGKFTKEIRKKMSESHIGQKAWNKDKKMTQEYCEIMSKAQTGKHKGKDNPFYGKTHTEESRIKMRKAKTTNKYKKWLKSVSKSINVRGVEYSSRKDFCKETKEPLSTVLYKLRDPNNLEYQYNGNS